MLLRSIFFGASLIFSAGASLASTSEFSIESSVLDFTSLSVEEAAFVRANNGDVEGRKAQLTLEVDCSMNNCVNRSYGVGMLDIHGSNGIFSLKSRGGFVDRLIIDRIAFDRFGNISEWHIWGGEYGQLGDFTLSNSGDSFSTRLLSDIINFCREISNSYPVRNDTCTDGSELPSDVFFDLGTSAWERNPQLLINDAPQLSEVPIPTTSLLLLAGMSGLLAIRRYRA